MDVAGVGRRADAAADLDDGAATANAATNAGTGESSRLGGGGVLLRLLALRSA
jgi:hypothetical protein